MQRKEFFFKQTIAKNIYIDSIVCMQTVRQPFGCSKRLKNPNPGKIYHPASLTDYFSYI